MGCEVGWEAVVSAVAGWARVITFSWVTLLALRSATYHLHGTMGGIEMQ